MFDLQPYEDRLKSAIAHFEDELKKIRTGRAHPAMLEGIMAEAYGTKMPLNQVANILAPEPQLLQVSPFDPSNIKAISDAIRNDQSLGFNPSDDGRVVRVPIPALTEERRLQLVKLIGTKVEDCRIAIRNIRQDALKDAKAKKEQKELSEDDLKRTEKLFDSKLAEIQAKVDELAKAKEKDVMTI
ncbi:MAG TPA: ribosome recycling factor [Verrucomicrobiae bacterium]|nr:ribosome recycling factor [Verrucomicrobiae bacterium]